MSDEEKFDTENEETQIDNEQTDETSEDINTSSPHFTHKISESGDSITHHLSGMFRTWFLDYASYVNLDRAVPDIYDGLKPVQRRILHSMREKEDGRYNKVANLVGHTMQYHPHGDASIKDALVQLGQKNFLIDKQGNWGNIMTGDDAAAGRYIEARLSKFALETVFSHKITEWKLSYDGRNKEPVTLPVKFPLLLAQGTEGIGVGLNSKILPHNFNELIDASIAYLRDEKFTLFPDFITGGSIDIAKYNNGERGGSVKIRAKIEKLDSKTLVIREIPYGTTVPDIIKSIIKANDSGKIKIRKVDDITAAHVEILIHLAPGVSSDKTIDALYAFTSCESSVSPNCCVIQERKPRFISVNELLQISTERTKDLLRQELAIQQDELREQYFFISLEKIFIENRIYKDSEFEQSESQELVVAHIYKRLEPFTSNFIRPVTDDDIFKLLEIRMKRITKYDSTKADETLIAIEKKLEDILFNLTNLTEYAIQWFTTLKDKYGKDYPRRTEIRNFESIEATKVIEATEKLYVNYEEGFIGTGLKKDEFVCNCSEIDDIIVFFRDGKYKIVKVTDKLFVGKNILHLNVYKKNDKRTIYNAVYRDGKSGVYYMKRFAVTGVSRDKEYDLTQKKAGSKVMYFSENPNGEAEIIRVLLKPKSRLLKLNFDRNFVDIAIKGRDSRGNILTKNEIQKISLRQKGGSTLGGRKVWFDPDVLRLNYDGRGELLGEFQNDDLILVLTTNGTFYTTNFELTNHYEKEAFTVEKFDPEKVWTVALYNAEEKHHYLKRFTLEPSAKPQSFLGDNSESTMDGISTADFPRFEIVFGESDSYRQPLIVDAESFIAVKSFNAKGKRLTTFQVKEIKELEPLRFAEPEDLPDETTNEEIINDEELPDENQIARTVRTISASAPQNLDDINPDEEGQLKLF
ncbi:MAG: DNA gyrase/topoisomerase IV subunit A [Paludibacter sp.]|jgi:topoisomerase-4 subunit A|nr:DNA gyrase/topoisomerase IV subunit A [Paludibacter sp.]